MPEKLTDQLISARVCIERDLGGEMPKLMRCHLHADMAEHRQRYRTSNCRYASRFALVGHKQAVRAPANNHRCNLVAKCVEPIGQRVWQFEFKRCFVFSFD